MTKIVLFLKNGEYTGFCAAGHAGYGVKGEDIVCSAISVLTTNTINSLDVLSKDEIEFGIDEDDGYLCLNLKTNNDPASQLFMKSLVMGLEGIREEYGSKFIKVDYKEENANVKA